MNDAEFFERRVGSTLRDKWTLERLLGVGGMAAVYVGVHKIGRRGAIKILHPEVAASAEIRARFEQEALAVNRFHHPGAVEIFDIDTTEDGSPFLVMELLEGQPLSDLARGEGVPLAQVLDVADQLLDVLAVAHEQGIVHRDIKPDNLFVTRERKLKVLDFGIARMKQGPGKGLATRTGTTLGTISYMPPEQVRGQQDIDGRADLFAVGATMFRLIARRRIHETSSELELIMKMAADPAPPLSQVAPQTPEGVCLVVDRALAFERDDRYQTAREMQGDVRLVASGSPPARALELGASRPLRQGAAPASSQAAVTARDAPTNAPRRPAEPTTAPGAGAAPAAYAPPPVAVSPYGPTSEAAPYAPPPTAATYAPPPTAATYAPPPQAPAYAPPPQPAAYAPPPQPSAYGPTSPASTYAPPSQPSTYGPPPEVASAYAPTSQAAPYSAAPQGPASPYGPTSQAAPYAPASAAAPPTALSQVPYAPTSQAAPYAPAWQGSPPTERGPVVVPPGSSSGPADALAPTVTSGAPMKVTELGAPMPGAMLAAPTQAEGPRRGDTDTKRKPGVPPLALVAGGAALMVVALLLFAAVKLVGGDPPASGVDGAPSASAQGPSSPTSPTATSPTTQTSPTSAGAQPSPGKGSDNPGPGPSLQPTSVATPATAQPGPAGQPQPTGKPAKEQKEKGKGKGKH